MRYSFYKALLKMKRHYVLYSLLLLELLVGISLLFFSLNYYFCYQKSLSIMEEMSANYDSSLKIYQKNDLNETEEKAFDEQDYQSVKSIFSDKHSIFVSDSQNSLIFGTDKKMVEIQFLYTNEVKRPSYLKKNSKLLNKLTGKNEKYSIEGKRVSLNSREMSLASIDKRKLQLFEAVKMQEIQNSDDIVTAYIFFPIEYLDNFNDVYSTQINIYLKNQKSTDLFLNKKNSFLSNLNGEHDVYSYNFENEFKNHLSQIQTQQNYMIFFSSLSILLLSIFLISFSGLFKIIIDKRLIELAIAESVGATKRKLIAELLFENYSISFVGVGLGTVIGMYFSLKISNDVFPTFLNFETFVIMLLLSISMTAIASAQGIKKIKKLTIYHLMQDGGI